MSAGKVDVLADCLAMLKQGAEMEAAVSGNAKHHFRVMQANCALAFLQSHGDALAELIAAAKAGQTMQGDSGQSLYFTVAKTKRLLAALAAVQP